MSALRAAERVPPSSCSSRASRFRVGMRVLRLVLQAGWSATTFLPLEPTGRRGAGALAMVIAARALWSSTCAPRGRSRERRRRSGRASELGHSCATRSRDRLFFFTFSLARLRGSMERLLFPFPEPVSTGRAGDRRRLHIARPPCSLTWPLPPGILSGLPLAGGHGSPRSAERPASATSNEPPSPGGSRCISSSPSQRS